MRSRFPLWLKKRGARRTGSPGLGRLGEVAYHATFIVAGAIGVWWCLSDVLIPESRLAGEVENFVRVDCVVIDKRVVARPGLAEDEYCPELQVEYAPVPERVVRSWTRHGVGRDAPSYQEAEFALEKFEKGDKLIGWFDPEKESRVVLTRGRRWWPWIVLSIPLSLIAAGVYGSVREMVSVQSSPERRASFIYRDAEPDLPDPVTDSPGVKLKHRLAADGGESWRLTGMAALCVLWNALAGIVAYQAASGYLSVGGRIGVTALAILPLAATGVWLLRSFWNDAQIVAGFGATRLELDQQALEPGESCRGVVLQSGAGRLRVLSIDLVCEEVATFRQGTDTRIATAEVERLGLFSARGVMIETGEPFQAEFELSVPGAAQPSFLATHNEIRWFLEVTVNPARSKPATRRFQFIVGTPTAVPAGSPA